MSNDNMQESTTDWKSSTSDWVSNHVNSIVASVLS